MKAGRILQILFVLGSLPGILLSTGTVYLVLGSDTAIWDGMSVNRYECTYNQALYTDPTENAYGVMDPAFRAQYTDSYGQALKMTWWMMAGNIFRYATNTNVPVPNIMTLYLMQKYHGNEVLQNGDELSLHYHTFKWTDYDQDGAYYWNQSLTFEECRDDFDVTLAQFLLEENVFPVSFRSGWHYMDNGWQHYLNDLLPYSLHNDWPAQRTDMEEPLDNTFDWSEAPSDFIPYRPSLENYQLDGDGPGWNVRSAPFQRVNSQGLMEAVFAQASTGVDQVACFWAHLPENDFLDNVSLMDELAHNAADLYPEVDFRYCTAIEAMQRWRGTVDTTGPMISIEEHFSGNDRYYTISSDEALFQPQPFVSAKFRDESYAVLTCTEIAENVWNTDIIPHPEELAKLGVAATDTSGNITTAFITPIPDDIYIDNADPQYLEISGNWSPQSEAAWGTDSRIAQVDTDHPIHTTWIPAIQQTAYYHIFIQVPDVASSPCPLQFVLYSGADSDTTILTAPLPAHEWIYLGTPFLEQGQDPVLELFSNLPDSVTSASIPVDVVKFSAGVRERDIRISSNMVNYGEVILDETSCRTIEISNRGLEELTIQSILSSAGHVSAELSTPFTVGSMDQIEVSLCLHPTDLGILLDTLIILNDDPMHPELQVMVTAETQYPFQVVDNEYTDHYSEGGEWYTSVAQAWGNSSRYTWLNLDASATFTLDLEFSGIYDVFEIVPNTVNSSNAALYILKVAGYAIDSVYQDQNAGSGDWVNLGRYYLPAGVPVALEVHDPGTSTVGSVLRADAIKFQMIEPVAVDEDHYTRQTPDEFRLNQNYPNPFNPVTTISYSLVEQTPVELTVFDIRGQQIIQLLDESKPPGNYKVQWNGLDRSGNPISTGVYFCRLQAGSFSQTIKMVVLQ
ncbi:MAG: T9SS type A sorting domain-containing protein [Candidatus Marinimicrobia bacterium]|nr:T9SS type A sorting domain-containing protein [Candidatus Neomarinimicrobiota bacterium]